ncbi:MAG: phosphatidylserine decarboxylase [Chlamydiae bacterium]|nr:phosphatidylserine decarboxylase [Chlamydiota bacterium]
MIEVFDREKQIFFEEKVLARKGLEVLYGDGWISKLFHFLITRFPLASSLCGFIMDRPKSREKIEKFIEEFSLDEKEFLVPKEHFVSFNDFFARRLRSEARPISSNALIAPADGRYLAFTNYEEEEGIFVKGKKFSLYTLLGNNLELAQKYAKGSFLIARLCPSDYHRFHFPCQGIPTEAKLIQGFYGSVNPIALKKNISIITENKRALLTIESDFLSDVLFVAVGATNVGSIHMTYLPYTSYDKGAELGYFAFGASMLLLFFEPGKVNFDPQILEMTKRGIETYIRFGESLTV